MHGFKPIAIAKRCREEDGASKTSILSGFDDALAKATTRFQHNWGVTTPLINFKPYLFFFYCVSIAFQKLTNILILDKVKFLPSMLREPSFQTVWHNTASHEGLYWKSLQGLSQLVIASPVSVYTKGCFQIRTKDKLYFDVVIPWSNFLTFFSFKSDF